MLLYHEILGTEKKGGSDLSANALVVSRHLAQACFFSFETVAVKRHVYGFSPVGIPHPHANLTDKLSLNKHCIIAILKQI